MGQWFAFRTVDGVRKLVELDPDYKPPVVNAPYVMCDTINEHCMATGRTYTSRKERNLDIKARGLQPVSWDWKPDVPPDNTEAEIVDEIRETKRALTWGEVDTKAHEAEMRETEASLVAPLQPKVIND